jgi:type VI protein secretion system component Hcp
MNTPKPYRLSLFSRRGRLPHLLCAVVALHVLTCPLAAVIIVIIPGVEGSVTVGNMRFESAFIADSFSFGVTRDTRVIGESGGTADINIGVGELQECTISKSMDRASTTLAQFAINGNSPGVAEIVFVETSGATGEGPYIYLKYKLDRCFVKSWSTSGDADDRPTEEVAFYYNKIAFAYRHTDDGVEFKTFGPVGWDATKQTPWTDSGITFDPPTPPQ